jgi:hypothetical protein
MKHAFLLVSLLIISCQSQRIVTSSQDAENSIKQGNYKNIKITEGSAYFSGPCEPSIAINPINTKNIVAGSILDNYHYSFDGGLSWKTGQLTSEFGVYGDPCVIADKDGGFYYLHLANPDEMAYASLKFLNQIVVQNSQDGGKSWGNAVGVGKNEPKQQDKEWAIVDPKNGDIYITWTEFDKYGSHSTKHKSRIRFVRSSDKGKTFTKAITISELEGDAKDDDKTTEGAVPAVDLDANIFVSWAYNNKIYFDKSVDKGETWMPEDKMIANQLEGWTQDIPGVGRCNGMPITAVDVSSSEYKNTIYVNWTDQRNGTDNTDVFLIKSSDKGETWSLPIKVNQDTSKTHQFFSWMSVDPITGYVYIVYYDRSRYAHATKKSDQRKTDVVLAVSRDGGTSFSNEIISEKPFIPSSTIFFGDYNNISAYNGKVRPIWTRYEDGKLSVWTAIINF